MKNYIVPFTLGLAILFGISNCQSGINDSIQQVSTIETQPNLVKKHVDENTFLDVDVYGLVKDISNPQTRASTNQEQVAKMKAAIYRFYSNVQLEDGYYICKLKSANDINVSVDVYTALLNNLNQMNAVIKEAKDKGKSMNTQAVDSEYLNSLLK